MRMLKNDIPMLEYDFHPAAAIMPDHENPRSEVAFQGGLNLLGGSCGAQAHHAEMAAHFVSATKLDPRLDHEKKYKEFA